jgi:hypothetical protein
MTKRIHLSYLAVALAFGTGIPIVPARADGGLNFVLESTIRVDPIKETVTLLLFKGMFNGAPVYYIVTESSDEKDAERRQVNYASKLRNALGTKAVQMVTEAGGMVHFAGTVAFASTHDLRPGPDGNSARHCAAEQVLGRGCELQSVDHERQRHCTECVSSDERARSARLPCEHRLDAHARSIQQSDLLESTGLSCGGRGER